MEGGAGLYHSGLGVVLKATLYKVVFGLGFLERVELCGYLQACSSDWIRQSGGLPEADAAKLWMRRDTLGTVCGNCCGGEVVMRICQRYLGESRGLGNWSRALQPYLDGNGDCHRG